MPAGCIDWHHDAQSVFLWICVPPGLVELENWWHWRLRSIAVHGTCGAPLVLDLISSSDRLESMTMQMQGLSTA